MFFGHLCVFFREMYLGLLSIFWIELIYTYFINYCSFAMFFKPSHGNEKSEHSSSTPVSSQSFKIDTKGAVSIEEDERNVLTKKAK